jgi:UDP-N-acetyl-D-mannosaminuronic acid dehydrogenase
MMERASGICHEDFFFSPERIMTECNRSRLRDFLKVVGVTDNEGGLKAFHLYKNFIKNLELVSSARVAEIIKFKESCYRYVNICLAYELLKISTKFVVDFGNARNNANHQCSR